jgi:hypothetical protein
MNASMPANRMSKFEVFIGTWNTSGEVLETRGGVNSMAETKTKPTAASVDAYLASRATPGQLADCKAIMAICRRVTKQPPKMWGPSIVGFGSYTYKYDSGHSGDACLTGFAVRGKDLVVYVMAESPEQVARLAKLGKHRMGKSCLYFKRLADLDVQILEALITASVAETRDRWGP